MSALGLPAPSPDGYPRSMPSGANNSHNGPVAGLQETLASVVLTGFLLVGLFPTLSKRRVQKRNSPTSSLPLIRRV